MNKTIQALEEAVSITKGEIPAARLTTNGHTYVPLVEYERLRAKLFKIQCEQLRVATSTSMTRSAMREGAMDTRNEIIAILGGDQQTAQEK
jgi:hypothetical protein